MSQQAQLVVTSTTNRRDMISVHDLVHDIDAHPVEILKNVKHFLTT